MRNQIGLLVDEDSHESASLVELPEIRPRAGEDGVHAETSQRLVDELAQWCHIERIEGRSLERIPARRTELSLIDNQAATRVAPYVILLGIDVKISKLLDQVISEYPKTNIFRVRYCPQSRPRQRRYRAPPSPKEETARQTENPSTLS